MEQWNSGLSKDFIDFYRFSSIRILPFTQKCSISKPMIPVFQHSTIPNSMEPL